ncbi:hypothetical protein BC940DRAFT_35744 [Gongronella butleri]|nr:hypothetical protein BC940DRAFT_35744 [Gongronella butleri]
MTRLNRLIYYLLLVLVFVFLSVSVLPSFFSQDRTLHANVQTAPRHGKPKSPPPTAPAPSTYATKYLSWLPHGEFTDQHEAFRNAVRLGKELNRVVIAPQLRLGHPLAWQPFPDLAAAYESQDQARCAGAHDTNDCPNWAEVPWSTFFDLQAIADEFDVIILERTQGHGWGVHESTSGVNDVIEDVVVVDVMTYAENTTLLGPSDKQSHPVSTTTTTSWSDSLRRFAALKQQPNVGGGAGAGAAIALTNGQQKKFLAPLRNVLSPSQWSKVHDRQYLQLGALSSTPRYPLPASKEQMALRRALSHHLFVTPNQLAPLTYDAYAMVKTLGGVNAFSSLRLNVGRVVAADARVASNVTSIDELDPMMQKKIVDAIVMEVFGDIPINQAFSAAMPVQKDTPLATVLAKQRHLTTHTPDDRQELLNACINYRQIELRYPIYYLVNDHIASPITRPDIYRPLLDFFPCLFTKDDMKRWGVIDMNTWIPHQPEFTDPYVDYVQLLEPMLDILVAGQGKERERAKGGKELGNDTKHSFFFLKKKRLLVL